MGFKSIDKRFYGREKLGRKRIVFFLTLFLLPLVSCYNQTDTNFIKMEKPEFPILKVKTGLGSEHAIQTPLLERIEFSAREKCSVARTYKDGAHYVITTDPFDPDKRGEEPSWTHLANIRKEGIENLEKIIKEEVVPFKDSTKSSPLDTRKIYWNFYLEGGEFNIITAAGSYESVPAFVRKLDFTINKYAVSPR